MGNILGLSSAGYVVDQVKLRQQKLGNVNLPMSDNDLTWAHSKTAWLRLASSVDINKDINPAKNNILFGGTTDYDGILRGGLTAYDSNSSFGYRPMATIIEADISYLNNNGTLQKATINIKAYSPEQLETIDKLYMRLGYSILLEWGHTVYLDNKSKNKTDFNTFTTNPFVKFFTYDTTQQDMYNIINAERELYFGNYEAFYGQIVKFNWTFNAEDATYDIKIEAISPGQIVESLKINTTLKKVTNEDSTTEETKPSIVSFKDASSFHNFLYNIYQEIGEDKDDKAQYSFPSDDLLKKYNIREFNVTKENITDRITKIPFFVMDDSWHGRYVKNNAQIYINLGFLLKYIESNQNLFITTTNSTDKKPYLTFDTTDDVYCLTFPSQMSSDPRICYIYNDGFKNTVGDAGYDFKVDDNPTIGRPLAILINIAYIIDLLSNLSNDKGEIILSDLLNNILTDINKCLGGVNKLTYKIFDNTVKIFDEIPLKYGNLKDSTEYIKYNVYGVRSNEGSFIKNIDFNVTITNDMATMITVGAQASGNQPGVNSTAFSKFNEGLIDRTKTEIYTDNSSYKSVFEIDEFNNLLTNFQKIVFQIYGSIKGKRILNDENVNTLTNLNSDFSKAYIGKIANEKYIPAPFFLPFDLNLTMIGLSGIKIFEKFALTEGSEKILPSYYRDNNGKSLIDFIVFDLKHSIKNNKWETTIKGKSIPSENEGNININSVLPNYNYLTANIPIPGETPSDYFNDVCGPRQIYPIPPSPFVLNDSIRREAMKKSYDYVFNKNGEIRSRCARYVYNLAYNYTQIYRNKSFVPFAASGGNARERNYWQFLVSLGYGNATVASNIPKQELKNLINNTQWNIGDVIVYYSNTGVKNESEYDFGHTQIYVGNINSTGWASSVKNNYSPPGDGKFVYNSSLSNCWNLVVFRAPNN
jgi:hypothetical protein